MSVLDDKIAELKTEWLKALRAGNTAKASEIKGKIEQVEKDLQKQKEKVEIYGTITPANMPPFVDVSAIPQESKDMIVFGFKRGEDSGNELYKGTMEQCKAWCRNEVPADYDSLNICQNNGVIEMRIAKDCKPAEDFIKLLEDKEKEKKISKSFTR